MKNIFINLFFFFVLLFLFLFSCGKDETKKEVSMPTPVEEKWDGDHKITLFPWKGDHDARAITRHEDKKSIGAEDSDIDQFYCYHEKDIIKLFDTIASHCKKWESDGNPIIIKNFEEEPMKEEKHLKLYDYYHGKSNNNPRSTN